MSASPLLSARQSAARNGRNIRRLVIRCCLSLAWLDDWIAMVEVWSVVRLAAAAEYRDPRRQFTPVIKAARLKKHSCFYFL